MRLIDADQFGVVSFQGKSEDYIDNEDFIKGVLFVLDKIHEAPTVERPHGEWENCGGIFCARCSVCKEVAYETAGNFCPNCGADMRGEAK